jgi:hypothetical protein
MKYAEIPLGSVKPNMTLLKAPNAIAPMIKAQSNLKSPSPRLPVRDGEAGATAWFPSACAAVCILIAISLTAKWTLAPEPGSLLSESDRPLIFPQGSDA